MKNFLAILIPKIDLIKQIFSNNSIRIKLISSYLVIIIPISLLLLFFFVYSLYLNAQYNQTIANFANYNSVYMPLDDLNKEIYFNITEQRKYNREKLLEIITKINSNIESIKYDQNNEEIGIKLEILQRTVKSLKRQIEDIGSLIKDNSDYKKKQEKLETIVQTTQIIKNNVQELMALDLKYSQRLIEHIRSGFYFTITIIIISFIITIIISMTFLLVFTRKIVNKIIKISDNANKLAEGQLDLDEITFKTRDEFQILALSFNKMKNNIKDFVSQISNNEKRISSILNSMNDCVITINTQGKIESCNYAVENVFEYKPSEIIGQNINSLISQINFSQIMSNPTQSSNMIENTSVIDGKLQFTGTKKDGTVFPIEVGFSEIDLENQTVFILVIHDITQHKEVEKLKDEFISTVSHEIRTPLTAILGSLDIILNVYAKDIIHDKAKELVDIAHRNGRRLLNLINDILDIEKIHADKMEFRFSPVELMSIIEQAVKINDPYAQKYNVSFNIVKSLPEVKVNVDPDRLIQVFTNLLSNAAKFSDDNKPVEISVFNYNNLVRIAITNFGQEIPEKYKSRIFRKFTQVDSSDKRKKGGTGLGLSISKAIVEKLCGNISFESDSSKTTFFVDLPQWIEG